MALRSFQEANSMEWRIRCTMQVCTTVSGKTALIASGKPFSPSTTAMRISPMPRFLSSFMTRSQNLAPSEVSIHSREYPSFRQHDAERDIDRLVADQAFIADLDPQRIEEDQRIHRLERPVLPLADGLEHRVPDRRDQVGRDIKPVD